MLFDYPFDSPLFEVVPFDKMTKRQAHAHYEWFIERIPSRLDLLLNAYRNCGGGDSLEYTRESLVPLWTWARLQLCGNQPSKMDFDHADKLALTFSGGNIVNGAKVSPSQLESLKRTFAPVSPVLSAFDQIFCIDIGYYYAEVLMRRDKAIKWSLMLKTTERNRPMLFLAYPEGWFEPTATIRSCALDSIRGSGNINQLVERLDIDENFKRQLSKS